MTDPIDLHFEDTGGAGRPVVLIHGWPLAGEAWAKQVPALRHAGYRVITYDRRGFGQSPNPDHGYDYDALTTDLRGLMERLDLRDVTLVGFSMGGGEVARYIPMFGAERIHSLIFASAVTPYMLRTQDNPDGPLTKDAAAQMEQALRQDRKSFFDGFTRDFFTANGTLKVSEDDRQLAITLCHQSDQVAALGCMASFGTTDFRADLPQIQVPVLVLHGTADGIVPIEGSGLRTHRAIPGSVLVTIADAPHGCNTSHPEEFNTALLDFLQK